MAPGLSSLWEVQFIVYDWYMVPHQGSGLGTVLSRSGTDRWQGGLGRERLRSNLVRLTTQIVVSKTLSRGMVLCRLYCSTWLSATVASRMFGPGILDAGPEE